MSASPSRLSALISELRRRRVFRALGLYLVGAWVAIEVTSTIFPLLLLPEWTPRAVVVLAFLGFPVVVVLAWAFDLTAEGLQRTVPSSERLIPATARVALVVATVLATGVAGWSARGVWLAPSSSSEVEARAPLDQSRVAVLYFDDFSDGSLGYLADALTESLIHELTQLEPLEVVSRNGVKPFRDDPIPLDSMARLLGAGPIVQGSVEGTADRAVATIQLIDSRTGVQLLSDRMETSGRDLLELRDAMVSEAARTLGQALGRELEGKRRRGETENAEAWELVQRARRSIEDADTLRWRLGDAEAAEAALEDADRMLAEASELDPEWPEPPLMRAQVRAEMARLSGTGRQERNRARLLEGVEFTNVALSRAPGRAEALAWRGKLLQQLSWLGGDSAEALLEAAESDLRAAVAADDRTVYAWIELAEIQRGRGDFAAAAIAADRALMADPFLIHAEQSVLFTLGHVWLELEQFDRALRWAREGQRRYPAVPAFAAEQLLIIAGWTGSEAKVDSAWSLVREVEEEYGIERWPHGHLQAAAVLARAGYADSARAVIAGVRSSGTEDPWLDYYEANVRVQLDEPDHALDLLAAFIDRMPHRRSYIARDWWWRPLRESERFQRLVADA